MRNAEHKDYESVNITSHSLCGAVPCVQSAVNITVRLLAPTLSPVKSSSGMAVMPDELLNQSARYDLVIIPAGADSDTIRSFVKVRCTSEKVIQCSEIFTLRNEKFHTEN